VTQGQDPLYPAIPLLTTCPLAAFAPQDATSVGPLRDVMRRFHALDVEKHPQRRAFSYQTPGKGPDLVLMWGVLPEQMTETCIPGAPLPHRGPLRPHMTQSLPCDVHALSKASNPCVEMLRQALRRADQMGQAALPEPLPVLRGYPETNV
jgi:hypothetical protein